MEKGIMTKISIVTAITSIIAFLMLLLVLRMQFIVPFSALFFLFDIFFIAFAFLPNYAPQLCLKSKWLQGNYHLLILHFVIFVLGAIICFLYWDTAKPTLINLFS